MRNRLYDDLQSPQPTNLFVGAMAANLFTLVTNLPISDNVNLDIITLLRLQMHCVLQSESDATDSEGTRSIMNLRK